MRRFPGKHIVSAVGIRRSESDGRSKAPTHKPTTAASRSQVGRESRHSTEGVGVRVVDAGHRVLELDVELHDGLAIDHEVPGTDVRAGLHVHLIGALPRERDSLDAGGTVAALGAGLVLVLGENAWSTTGTVGAADQATDGHRVGRDLCLGTAGENDGEHLTEAR